MIVKTLTTLMLVSRPAGAIWSEFGRPKPIEWSRYRLNARNQDLVQTSTRAQATTVLPEKWLPSAKAKMIERFLQDSMEEVVDESIDMISMSMSLSMLDVPGDGTSDAGGNQGGGPVPTPAPILNAPSGISSIPSDFPSLAPSGTPNSVSGDLSSIPSDYPSLAPTGISNLPTSPPVVTGAPTQGVTLFGCNGGLTLGTASDGTPIFVRVGYSVESSSNSNEIYQSSLERNMLETAVLAALDGCNENVRRRLSHETESALDHHSRRLQIDTLIIGPCDATLNETESCIVMETELLFYLKGNFDEDVVAYTSTKAIQNHMLEDKYVGVVPTVLLVEYLSPLPLIRPPTDPPISITDNAGIGSSTLRSTESTEGLQVSPWAIGASVATVMGGVISLMVFHRNRNVHRQRQSMNRRRYERAGDLEQNDNSPVAI